MLVSPSHKDHFQKVHNSRSVAASTASSVSQQKSLIQFTDKRFDSLKKLSAFPGNKKVKPSPNINISVIQRGNGKDGEENNSSGGGDQLDNTSRNQIVRAQIDPRMRAFYLSLPAFQARNLLGFHTYGLNPFAMPISLMRNWGSLDPSLSFLRAFGGLNSALNRYTDTSPGALVSRDQMSNFRWNMLAMGDGLLKRTLLQTIAINAAVSNPRLRYVISGVNMLVQLGGQTLLKDQQIRQFAQEQNLTVAHFKLMTRILNSDFTVKYFGRPGRNFERRFDDDQDPPPVY